MSKPAYDRKRVRRAMWAAPAVGVIGILPFVFQLNLTIVQFLIVILAAVIMAYLLGLIFGAPGYLTLRKLGYPQTRYLLAYATVLVVATPILLDDVYALLSFGPPVLIAAGAFCFLRGPEISESGVSSDNA